MKRYIPLVILCSSLGTVVNAVPVVPNFTQGSMQTSTNTTSTVTETINSIDYRTGWEYTVTGVGVENAGEPLNPTVKTELVEITPSAISGQNLEGDASTATGRLTTSFDSLDLSNQGAFTISNPGESFQFSQSYSGPGMTNQTVIQRVTEIESVTNTTSIFSN